MAKYPSLLLYLCHNWEKHYQEDKKEGVPLVSSQLIWISRGDNLEGWKQIDGKWHCSECIKEMKK